MLDNLDLRDGEDLIKCAVMSLKTTDSKIKSAELTIAGEPCIWSKSESFSEWLNGLKGTDPETIDGKVRIRDHPNSGGFNLRNGIVTSISRAGRPSTGDVRCQITLRLTSDEMAFVRTQGARAAYLRNLIRKDMKRRRFVFKDYRVNQTSSPTQEQD